MACTPSLVLSWILTAILLCINSSCNSPYWQYLARAYKPVLKLSTESISPYHCQLNSACSWLVFWHAAELSSNLCFIVLHSFCCRLSKDWNIVSLWTHRVYQYIYLSWSCRLRSNSWCFVETFKLGVCLVRRSHSFVLLKWTVWLMKDNKMPSPSA